ncbi:MAG TPA: DUF4349 domain-containing protein [Burkholderiaceae bacterium]|jgi:hypothetical protein
MTIKGRWLVGLGLTVSLAACGQANKSAALEAVVAAPRDARNFEKVAPEERLLSYSHTLALKLPSTKIKAAYESLLSHCQAVPEQGCVVTNSSISSDAWRHAETWMMIRRDAVAAFRTDAEALGTVVGKSTKAEDLTAPVADTNRRLAMKKALRDDLLVLRKQSNKDIQALLTVTQSLAQVQSEIEADEAAVAGLRTRVAMDELRVELQSENERPEGPNPVVAAFKDFGNDLARGAGAFISFVALSLPWLLLVAALPFIWRGLRRIWRFGRR